MSITAIGAVAPRRRTTVRGEVASVVSYDRPWVRTDAAVADGAGSLLLRFLGRAAIPGLEVGRQIEAEGTPGVVHGALVILNPRYVFPRSSDHRAPAGSRCQGRS